jgi:hypothetical protein
LGCRSTARRLLQHGSARGCPTVVTANRYGAFIIREDKEVEEDIRIPSLNGARVLVIENDPFVAAELDLMVRMPEVRPWRSPEAITTR